MRSDASYVSRVRIREVGRHLLAISVPLLVAAIHGCAGTPEAVFAARPNIVLVIGDDHGFGDFGFMGSKVASTPHLDSLAAGGTTFRVGYTTASVCPAALRSLLTGLYPKEWPSRLRPPERVPEGRGTAEIELLHTLPRLLQAQGYKSFQAGKYWEGTFAQGGFTHGMTRAVNRLTIEGQSGGAGLAFGRPSLQPAWDFIDAHAGQPFFMWFAPMLPHRPHDAPQDFALPYVGMNVPEAALQYYANVSRFDAVVGDLVAYLNENNLREKTLIVYVADNGWDAEAGTAHLEKGGPKGKASLYEIGFRTPLIFNWPGHVSAGVESNALVSTVDLFPTLLEYAQAPALPYRSGLSLVSTIRGDTDAIRESIIGTMQQLRTDRPVGSSPQQRARKGTGAFLRNEKWHYLWNSESGEELYDIASDPDENQNVANENLGVAKRLREQVQRELERRTAAPPE